MHLCSRCIVSNVQYGVVSILETIVLGMEMINTTESYRVMAETFLHSTVQSKPYISLKQDRATKQTVRAAIELLKQTFIHRIISRYYRKYRLSPFDDSTSAGDIETGEGSQGRRDVASKQK